MCDKLVRQTCVTNQYDSGREISDHIFRTHRRCDIDDKLVLRHLSAGLWGKSYGEEAGWNILPSVGWKTPTKIKCIFFCLYLYMLQVRHWTRGKEKYCQRGVYQSTDKRNQMSYMLIASLNIFFDERLLYPYVTIWSYSICVERTNNLDNTKFSNHQIFSPVPQSWFDMTLITAYLVSRKTFHSKTD